MADAAGVRGGKDRGLVLTRLSSEPVPGLSLYAANYLVPDVFNTAYGYGEYAHNLTSDLSFNTGLQHRVSALGFSFSFTVDTMEPCTGRPMRCSCAL
jgi:hypothetical protein